MNTATMTFNEAINTLAAGYHNDMANQALAIHKQRDKSEAVLKLRISTLEAENGSLKEKIAILEALVSQHAATAVSAMDDLSDSVIAEEAYAQAQEESEGEALVASVTGVTAVPKKPRAPSRDSSKLTEILPEGTPLSLTSTGDRWDGSFTKEGFIFKEKLFKSPLAVMKTYSERITDRHPKATQPGSGWVFIKVEAGPYKGKSLGEAYDTFNKRVGMVGGGAMSE
jgi:hypothetical protein